MELADSFISENLALKDGVTEILEYFKAQNILLAVASNTVTPVVENRLKRVGIRKYFDAIVGGDQVAKSKPAPDIFITAAEKLCLKPQDCYAFEDSLNGIIAAHSAGCVAIMIPDQIQPSDDIRAQCHTFTNLRRALLAIQHERKEFCGV